MQGLVPVKDRMVDDEEENCLHLHFVFFGPQSAVLILLDPLFKTLVTKKSASLLLRLSQALTSEP